MTEIWFYHLTQSRLEFALPKLLEKTLAGKRKAVLRCASDATMQSLNELLWTYQDDSFLPHGSAREAHAEHQPIYLTCEEENPNAADILFSVDGTQPGIEVLAEYARLIYLFDSRDIHALQQARNYWKQLKDRPDTQNTFTLAYWKQNDRGGWEQAG